MQHEQGVTPPRRRRWRREKVNFTVLGRFAGGDRLGKAVNLSDRGLGAVFQGRGYAADHVLELRLVAGCAVRRVFGVVRSATPRGCHTRLGIRTFGYVPGDPREVRSWAAARKGPASGPPPAPRIAGFHQVSPGGMWAMERDRWELARDLHLRYGADPGEPWEDVLRRFLAHLPHSPLRSRFLREQFRFTMHTRHPVPAGTVISGTLVTGGTGAFRDVPPCVIHLDHFPVACSDGSGRFVAGGIPPLDDAVSVPLRVATHAVLSPAPVAVFLPRLDAVAIDVELPIALRSAPGRVASRAVSGAHPVPADFDLQDLYQLVDQL